MTKRIEDYVIAARGGDREAFDLLRERYSHKLSPYEDPSQILMKAIENYKTGQFVRTLDAELVKKIRRNGSGGNIRPKSPKPTSSLNRF